MENTPRESSIIVKQTEKIQKHYPMASTVTLVIVLVVSLVLLKKLIYISDDKRDLK